LLAGPGGSAFFGLGGGSGSGFGLHHEGNELKSARKETSVGLATGHPRRMQVRLATPGLPRAEPTVWPEAPVGTESL
jgi:hypothetical protein